MDLIGIALAPSLLWLWYFWRQERATTEGAGPLARAFLWGAASVIPAVILELIFSKPGDGATFLECFLVIGPAEELSKLGATILAIRNETDFDEPSDGIVAAAAVALGFAFAENIGYFAGAHGSLVIVRTLLSVPGHVLFAVFYGAALGRMRCMPGVTWLAVAHGLVVASVLHGLFDALLFHAGINPLLFLGMFALLVWFQWRMYKQLAAACAAEGRALRAQAASEIVFVDAAGVPLDGGAQASGAAGQPIHTGAPPSGDGAPVAGGEPGWSGAGALGADAASCGAGPAPGVCAAQVPREAFRWVSVVSSFFYGLGFFVVTAIIWHFMVPESQHAARAGELGALCIVALVLGGLVSAYRSPGRTVRESAIGLALLGLLVGGGGAGDGISGSAFAVVMGFLGAFGGWLGEALQDARGRDRRGAGK